MKTNGIMQIKWCELPMLLELIGPNGETLHFEILLTKGRLGVFLNKVSKTLCRYISKN